MKKTIPIIITIAVVLAVVVIGYFGVKSLVVNPTIFIESIEIENKDENNIIELDFENGETTVDLVVKIRPVDASNQELDFISSNKNNVTVTSEGKVTMLQEGGATITVRTKDGTNFSDTVKILPKLNSVLVNIGYDFPTHSISGAAVPGVTGAKYFMDDVDGLVVFTHNPFIFDFGNTKVEIVGTQDVVTLEENTFTPLKKGVFTAKFSKEVDGEVVSKNLDVKVVEYLKELGDETGYADYEYEKDEGNKFLEKDVVYEIGHKNNYTFDFSATNFYNASINNFEMKVTLSELTGATYVPVESLATYLTFVLGNNEANVAFKFNEAAEGKVFKLTLAAKYQANQNVTIEFMVNEGVNVNNHAQLTTAVEDLSITKINIHRQINIVIDPAKHLYTDAADADLNGTLINEYTTVSDSNSADYGKTGHIYYRAGSFGDFSIVGNLQTINGSAIPRIRKHTKDDHTKPGSYQSGDVHIEIQSAIFRMNNSNESELSVKNLKVDGNTYSSGSVVTSGGVMLFNLEGQKGDTHFDNINLFGGVISLNFVNRKSMNYVNKAIINEAYNSGISLWTSKMTISNSKLSRTGGPAIQVIDNDNDVYNPADPTTASKDPMLFIDEYTLNNIENWVTGGESWFVGLGFSIVASEIQSGLNAAAGEHFNKTILKNITSDGEEYSAFNLKILVHTSEFETNGDVQAVIVVINDDDEITFQAHHPHNFATSLGGEQTYLGAMYPGFLEAFINFKMTQTMTPEQQLDFANGLTQNNMETVTFVSLINSQISAYIEWFDLQP